MMAAAASAITAGIHDNLKIAAPGAIATAHEFRPCDLRKSASSCESPDTVRPDSPPSRA